MMIRPRGSSGCNYRTSTTETGSSQWKSTRTSSEIHTLTPSHPHTLTPSHPHRANKKGSFGPVSVHAWYGSSAKVVMAIWKMARDQHMFYRSKRASRVSPHTLTPSHPHSNHRFHTLTQIPKPFTPSHPHTLTELPRVPMSR